MMTYTKYTFIFRCCDILPEVDRQQNSVTRHPMSAALNEILRIPLSLGVLWENVEGIEEAECNGDGTFYTVTASTVSDEDQDYFIRQRYKEYKKLRGMLDVPKDEQPETTVAAVTEKQSKK